MKYLQIQNPGIIEHNAFYLLGACTKRDQKDKIGYFGSGLKYAIAVLLRNDIPFHIYAGSEEIKITTQQEFLREEPFDVIYINGNKTSLTTAMGPDWKLWQAVREIFCNALDEGKYEITHHDSLDTVEKDGTSFIIDVSHSELQEIINNWDFYFAHNRKPVMSCPRGKVYARMAENACIYRKQIRCYEDKYNSLFDYDMDNLKLNESRIMTSEFDFKTDLARLWIESANPTMIQSFIHRIPGKQIIEDHIYWEFCYSHPNDYWFTLLKDMFLVPDSLSGWFKETLDDPDTVILPYTLVKKLKDAFPEFRTGLDKTSSDDKYLKRDFSEEEHFKLKKAMSFLEDVGLVLDYPVFAAEFKDTKIYGLADIQAKEILLSKLCFEHGIRRIVLTLMEEAAHIDSGAGDETLEFQNFLFNQILTMLEKQHCNFL